MVTALTISFSCNTNCEPIKDYKNDLYSMYLPNSGPKVPLTLGHLVPGTLDGLVNGRLTTPQLP